MSKQIVLVDDHVLLRKGLVDFVSKIPDCKVVGEAGNSEEFFTLLKYTHPELVILDVSLPKKNGFDIFSELRAAHPKIKVLFFTMHMELPYFEKAREVGAEGYVTKDMAPELLEEAINRIYKGQTFFDIEKLQPSFSLSGLSPNPFHHLSKRETEVMHAIVAGISLTGLGEKLGLSVKTISSHRARLFEKLKISSNAELVKMYVAQNPPTN